MSFSEFPLSSLRGVSHRQSTKECAKENNGITKLFLKDLIKGSFQKNADATSDNKTGYNEKKLEKDDKNQSFNVSYTWETDSISGFRDKQLFKKKSSVLYHMVTFNHGLKASIVEELKLNEGNQDERLNFINNFNVEKCVEKCVEKENIVQKECSYNYDVIKLEIEFISTMNLLTHEELEALHLFFFPENTVNLLSANEHVSKENIIETFLLDISSVSKKYTQRIKAAYDKPILSRDTEYITLNDYLRELRDSREIEKNLKPGQDIINEVAIMDVENKDKKGEDKDVHVVGENIGIEARDTHTIIKEPEKKNKEDEQENEAEIVHHSVVKNEEQSKNGDAGEKKRKRKYKKKTENFNPKNHILINLRDYDILQHNDQLFISLTSTRETGEEGRERVKEKQIEEEKARESVFVIGNCVTDPQLKCVDGSVGACNKTPVENTDIMQNSVVVPVDVGKENIINLLQNTNKKVRKYTKRNDCCGKRITNNDKKARTKEKDPELANCQLNEQLEISYPDNETSVHRCPEVVNADESWDNGRNMDKDRCTIKEMNLINDNLSCMNKVINPIEKKHITENQNTSFDTKHFSNGINNTLNVIHVQNNNNVILEKKKKKIINNPLHIQNDERYNHTCDHNINKANADITCANGPKQNDNNIEGTKQKKNLHIDGNSEKASVEVNNRDGEVKQVLEKVDERNSNEKKKKKSCNESNKRATNRSRKCVSGTNEMKKNKKALKIIKKCDGYNKKEEITQVTEKENFERENIQGRSAPGKNKKIKNGYSAGHMSHIESLCNKKNNEKKSVHMRKKTCVNNYAKDATKFNGENASLLNEKQCTNTIKKRASKKRTISAKRETNQLCDLSNHNIIQHTGIKLPCTRSYILSSYIIN
ncbi:conserved Plasmodium protein, unknown function [Plasmodium ovale wallikeri]|uniref:Uncharacterized protein n=1 Tax=Plasmodium ovale wallikeri TaxID=864142 RepID=A0A1A8ZZW7_PLAOA|nr:conserved Plasmodium protein, unknown function [Plasmodium ovale wallikeri]SBT49833.1 conserved Plasmodium protein, unknown function [Plasmodium ovale wallikeri]